jgi:DNA polymerase-3 subunit delta
VQLKPDQLPAALARGLAPVYLLAGDESLLVADAAIAVRGAARAAGYDERVVHEVERGFDWSLLRGEVVAQRGNTLLAQLAAAGRAAAADR